MSDRNKFNSGTIVNITDDMVFCENPGAKKFDSGSYQRCRELLSSVPPEVASKIATRVVEECATGEHTMEERLEKLIQEWRDLQSSSSI